MRFPLSFAHPVDFDFRTTIDVIVVVNATVETVDAFWFRGRS